MLVPSPPPPGRYIPGLRTGLGEVLWSWLPLPGVVFASLTSEGQKARCGFSAMDSHSHSPCSYLGVYLLYAIMTLSRALK